MCWCGEARQTVRGMCYACWCQHEMEMAGGRVEYEAQLAAWAAEGDGILD